MTERKPGDYQEYASAHEHDIVLNEHRKDEILGGRYRVLSLLGRGGMGVVYRVEQIFLGKELALKTIDQTAQSDIAIRRFQAEARAVFAVNHPNIVAVHDFGLLDDQTPFLAMELVKGRTIGEIIQTRNLSVDQILKVFIQVCHGLAHAHKCGVVHRDIKPNNIMVLDGMPLGTEGSIKILDFGIAKLTQHEGGELQALTRTGEIFGSPIYMSPEQCTGGTVDYRSDIYSLGCVLFEALTGTPPFVGESALSTMMMHQTGAIPTLKEASLGNSFAPELEQIVGAMLSKVPNERYQDLSVAAGDLASVNSGQSTTINVPTAPIALSGKRNDSTISLKRSHYALWIVASATMSTLITILSMQIWFLNQPKPLAPRTKVPPLTLTQLSQVIQNPTKDAKEAHVVFDRQIARNENSFTARIVSDQDFEAFRNYTGAQIIEARDLSEHDLTNKGLSYLKNSKVLQLSLRGDLQGLDNFTQLKHINILSLSKSFLSDGALSNIAKLKMLSELDLENVRNLTENQIRELTHSNSLKTLILTQRAYSHGLIEELHEKIPRCTIMNYDFEDKKNSARHPSLEEQFRTITTQVEKARAANPDSSAVALYLQQLGDIRRTQHRNRESLALLERGIHLLEKNGNDNALPPLLADAAAAAGEENDLPLAIKYSDRLVDLAPGTMLHNERDMYDWIARVLQYPVRLQQWAKAVRYCNTAIQYFEIFPKAVKSSQKIQFYADAGDYNVALGRKSEALADYQKLLELTDPNSPKDLYWRASAFVRMGRCLSNQEEQKASCLKGMKMIEDAGMPDEFNLLEHYCDACVNAAVILKNQGNLEEALAMQKKGLNAVEQKMTNTDIHKDARARKRAFTYDIALLLQKLDRPGEVKAIEQKYKFKLGVKQP